MTKAASPASGRGSCAVSYGLTSALPLTMTAGQGDPLARALGVVSLALAVPPLAAPDQFNAALGVRSGPPQRAVALIAGAREVAAGVGLLIRPSPAGLWARVVGDAMDLTVLGTALIDRHRRGVTRTAAATAAVAGITALDLYAAITRSGSKRMMELTATTTIGKSPREVYAYWRRLENLPSFMAHLDEVRANGDRASHWRAHAPFGRTVEWDAEITEDVAGERLAWHSVGKTAVPNEGAVRFVRAPGDQGTEVHVWMCYAVPGGVLGRAVARYFGEEPHQQLDDDLRRLKQVLETGEVLRSDGAPGGKRARREFPQRPARPLTPDEIPPEARP